MSRAAPPGPSKAGPVHRAAAIAKPGEGPATPAAPVRRPVPIWSLAFSPDGKTLAAGSYQKLQLWDAVNRTPVETLGGHSGPVRCLAWSADGKLLAAGGGRPGETGEVRVWNTAGEPVPNAASPKVSISEHKDVVEGVAFAPSGSVVLSASMDEKALAVELATKKTLGTMRDHTNRVTAVAVSPTGKYVATGSLDKTVKIWNGTDYKPLANVDANVGQVYALVFLPNDRFAAAGEDGGIRFYQVSEGKSGNLVTANINQVRQIGGNRTPLFALAASPDGKVLAAGGEDHTVRVYINGNQKYTFKEPADAIYALAVSPDGSTIAAGGRDGKLRLWNAADGKLIAEL